MINCDVYVNIKHSTLTNAEKYHNRFLQWNFIFIDFYLVASMNAITDCDDYYPVIIERGDYL